VLAAVICIVPAIPAQVDPLRCPISKDKTEQAQPAELLTTAQFKRNSGNVVPPEFHEAHHGATAVPDPARKCTRLSEAPGLHTAA
jgi:hypothetical protein